MKIAQTIRYAQAIQPGPIVDNAAFTSVVVDTLGFEDVTFILSLGSIDAALAGLKVTESDTAGGAQTDVPTSAYAADELPGATDDGKLYGVHVVLINRKRFLRLVATAGDGAAGTYASALALLTRPKTEPSDAASRGLAFDKTVIS